MICKRGMLGKMRKNVWFSLIRNKSKEWVDSFNFGMFPWFFNLHMEDLLDVIPFFVVKVGWECIQYRVLVRFHVRYCILNFFNGTNLMRFSLFKSCSEQGMFYSISPWSKALFSKDLCKKNGLMRVIWNILSYWIFFFFVPFRRENFEIWFHINLKLAQLWKI